MNTTTNTLVQKLWNYCSVLRDDGMSYGDYVEQLTYLLFLKMADERSQPPYNQASIVPAAYAWPTLLGRDGDALPVHGGAPPQPGQGCSESPWTKKLWIYDLRTNQRFTLKTNPMRRSDLDEFVALYQVGKRHERSATWSAEKPDGRWRAYGYKELLARDKTSLDIFWLKDDSLADSDTLPAPAVIAQEIVEDLQAALEQFRLIASDVGADVPQEQELPAVLEPAV